MSDAEPPSIDSSNRAPAMRALDRKAVYVSPCLMKFGSITSITGSKQSTSLVDTMGGTAGNTTATMMSDRRLKSRVVRIGQTAHGLDYYEYDIEGRRERGVMADEAARVVPQAVSTGPDGYLRVDYALLGVPRPRSDAVLLTRASAWPGST